jgi:gamma-glutamylputrescine oxidase
VIERTVGPKQAQLLGQMAFEGGRIIRERVAKYNIQCDLKDGGVFAASPASRWATWNRRSACGSASATRSWS